MTDSMRLEHYAGRTECRGLIEKIYVESFPPSERRPVGEWWRMIGDAQSPLQLQIIIDSEGEAVGFISFWRFRRFVYVEHFAIEERHRCGGTGAKAMRAFLEHTHLPVVLEVERKGANEMADRRIGFYMRVGFRPVEGFDYVQPPYAPGLPEVPLLLMSTDPEAVEPSEIADTLFREVYGAR